MHSLRHTVVAWLIGFGAAVACAQAHAEPAANPAVTFSRDIAPIVMEHCASCHRPGQVAPFPLLSFQEVRKHAKDIEELTANRTMPPWKPEPGFGDFLGVRRLTDGQIDLISQWVRDGKPQGDASQLPPAPAFSADWGLGKPDMIVRMPQAYTLRADGGDDYRCFVVPLNLTEDKYVTAFEFRASTPRIVHHSLFYLDGRGKARQLEAESNDGRPGYFGAGGPGFAPTGFIGGWAPGVMPQYLPQGAGKLVRAGSDLVFQTHFHPSGKVEQERSTLALYFAKTRPAKQIVTFGRENKDIDIPPADSHYERVQEFPVRFDLTLAGIFPHAHLLCRQIKVTATLPDGSVLPLIWIKDWDWNWQGGYFYKQPLHIPRGTKVRQEFVYDNSEGNIHNPNNPPQRIHYGQQTGDEMALVFYDVLVNTRRGSATRPSNNRTTD